MILFGGHLRAPGFGPLPRALAVSALAAFMVMPLAASAAGAAPAAPTAYALYGSAQPLRWIGSPPVSDLVVPFVEGKTSNLANGHAEARLAEPDEKTATLSGDAVAGLTCTGYSEKACNKDAFVASALAAHPAPPEHANPAHREQTASFFGPEGKWPGNIQAMTDCPGQCGAQLVRSVGRGSASSGRLPGYVRVGSSSASHDLDIDDKGRLISSARSELRNVVIGPNNEIEFSSLVTSAHGFGSGPSNTKDGKADVRIADFFILGTPVELTRAGLRLANPGPSEQEAYDGAKALVQELRKRGIVLELPNFDAQLVKTPTHVAVDSQGLRVRFEHSAGPVQAGAVAGPLELGRATAVVAALDGNQKIDIEENSSGGVTVQTTAPTTAPVAGDPRADNGGDGGVKVTPSTGPKASIGRRPRPEGTSQKAVTAPRSGTPSTAPVPDGELPVPPVPVDPAAPGGEVTDPATALTDPNLTALPSISDVQNKLGLRGAQSVSRAFGAFLGLGLILPLARFVIRRLG